MTDFLILSRIADGIDRIADAAAISRRKPQKLPRNGMIFQWDPARGFRPVNNPALMLPDLLVGVDRQKERFYGNVERFLGGKTAHNVLLWGERGTGKSSLVRSLPVRFDGSKLGLVSLAESHLEALPELLCELADDHRRWVVYLDDLGFSDVGIGYHELKVLLDGGLESRPPNTLLSVTSNRRHMVPERFPDDDEIHPAEAIAETVSLADRFGISLGFYPFDEPTYLAAVGAHMADLGVQDDVKEWRSEALQWAMERGIRSGRSARQFGVEWAGRS